MNVTERIRCQRTAEEAARLGAAVLAKWRRQFKVREKARFDLVTDADLESQQVIRDQLLNRFPEHHFLGEEDPQPEKSLSLDDPPTWIVDPLDGTTNHVHYCPGYCVSIGLWVAGEMVVGVIYEPLRDEMFSSARGEGAFLNGTKIQVSETGEIGNALLGTGFPPQLRGDELIFEYWKRCSIEARALRRTGSTALNMAYVAAGRFDGWWSLDNHVWDVAAGIVLIEEAGGRLSNRDGSRYDPFTPDSVASNGGLHSELLRLLK